MDGPAPRLIQLDLGAAATSADEEMWPGDPAEASWTDGEMGRSGSTISPQLECPGCWLDPGPNPPALSAVLSLRPAVRDRCPSWDPCFLPGLSAPSAATTGRCGGARSGGGLWRSRGGATPRFLHVPPNLSAFTSLQVQVSEVVDRVEELMGAFGLSSYDAVHVATGEYAGAAVVVTTDARFASVPEARLTIYTNASRVGPCRRMRGRR
jgi:hypothetical protein